MKRGSATLLAACLVLAQANRAAAELPAFLRKENSSVRDGNEQLGRGDAKAALESYTHAARELPDSAGVQLNRGLALLKQGEFNKAREALLAATQPTAPSELRADAYEDLALGFYREADGLAKQNKHDEAQKLFREALDAAKRSLRLRPGDPNTAWNLELAARRVHEEEEKQKQEDEKKKQDKKDQDQKNQDQKDQDKSQDPNADQNQQKSDDDKKQQPDSQNGDQKDKPSDKNQQQDDAAKKPDQPPKPPEGQKKPETSPAEQDPAQADQQKPDKALPPEAAQALDALEGGEENFERYRARQRAARERRAPEKDW